MKAMQGKTLAVITVTVLFAATLFHETEAVPPPPPSTGIHISSLSADLATARGKRIFGTFLENNERALADIEVSLAPGQAYVDSSGLYGPGEMLVIDAINQAGGKTQGYRLIIDLNDGWNDMFFDREGTPQRLLAFLKIVGIAERDNVSLVSASPLSIEDALLLRDCR